ncbi:ASN_collapsed_G0048090.mRNA.1.CDS.1 [Saccharomyces cerevisiae]|nr:ASN_collapsed_G0048090.mRNA.1.CDS.1 [Saccharomyces cerevisiae]
MPSSRLKDVQVLANMEANLEKKSVPVASSPISSIIPRTSRNKNLPIKLSPFGTFTSEITNEWNQVSSTEYKRTLVIEYKI